MEKLSSVSHLLCFSFTTHTEPFTFDTSGHQMCRFFPHQAIPHDISWVSYN